MKNDINLHDFCNISVKLSNYHSCLLKIIIKSYMKF